MVLTFNLQWDYLNEWKVVSEIAYFETLCGKEN